MAKLGDCWMISVALNNIFPQLGVGGWMPSPKES